MQENHRIPENFLMVDAEKVEKILQHAARLAWLKHKRAGAPIVIGIDGKVVLVPPEEIEVEDSEDKTQS